MVQSLLQHRRLTGRVFFRIWNMGGVSTNLWGSLLLSFSPSLPFPSPSFPPEAGGGCCAKVVGVLTAPEGGVGNSLLTGSEATGDICALARKMCQGWVDGYVSECPVQVIYACILHINQQKIWRQSHVTHCFLCKRVTQNDTQKIPASLAVCALHTQNSAFLRFINVKFKFFLGAQHMPL